ncbi:MAG: beta-N-acetylhexosaminidase [Desulfomonilaceae bacterium]|jgi:beta-N-acetylhexosaminidase
MMERDFGRLFMVGFYGSAFCPELQSFLDALNPAGVILFSRNILEPRQVAELNFSIQQFSIEKLGRPLLIGVDQEGGRVKRLTSAFSEFPPVMTIAESEFPEEAIRRFAETTARELSLVGFNLDFVPVLDVLGEGIDTKNTVIGDRSFGPDPIQVANLGTVLIRAMRSEGILTCGKHFPGHGGIAVDSHLDLPIDSRPSSVIMERDIFPFIKAIEAGTDMIMTAHVVFPAFDETYPASLSPTLIDDVLRQELKFHGLVVTDDLDMGAISKHYRPEEAALLAYQAGTDIMLICNSPETAFTARQHVYESTKDGPLAKMRFNRTITATESLFSNLCKAHESCDLTKVANYFSASSINS